MADSCRAFTLRQPQRINKRQQVAINVRIVIITAGDADGVGLDVAAQLGVVVAVDVLEQAGFAIEVLTGKAQVESEGVAVTVRVFTRWDEAEGFAGAPASSLGPLWKKTPPEVGWRFVNHLAEMHIANRPGAYAAI